MSIHNMTNTGNGWFGSELNECASNENKGDILHKVLHEYLRKQAWGVALNMRTYTYHTPVYAYLLQMLCYVCLWVRFLFASGRLEKRCGVGGFPALKFGGEVTPTRSSRKTLKYGEKKINMCFGFPILKFGGAVASTSTSRIDEKKNWKKLKIWRENNMRFGFPALKFGKCCHIYSSKIVLTHIYDLRINVADDRRAHKRSWFAKERAL